MTKQETVKTTSLRLTNRGKAVFGVLGAALAFALSAFFGGTIAGAGQSNEASDLQYISVVHGETLWNIANEIAPNADPRDVIAEIMQLNALSSSSLTAGDSIAIPSKYSN